MKKFKEYRLFEAKEEAPKPEPKKAKTEISDWTFSDGSWLIRFGADGDEYVASFTALDSSEKHWKFTYYRFGQRNSSDIRKYGHVSSWDKIWTIINDIIKEHIKYWRPQTIRFTGLTITKRTIYYRKFFQIYTENFSKPFRSLGYICSFDYNDINLAPAWNVKKHGKDGKAVDEKTKEEKRIEEENIKSGRDLVGTYKFHTNSSGNKVYLGKAKFTPKGQGIVVMDVAKVVFPDGSTIESPGFTNSNDAINWSKQQKPAAKMSASYIKQFGTEKE